MAETTSECGGIPEADLGSLLDAAAEALVLTEADGRIVGWNAAAEALFGWTREEAVGVDIWDLILPERLRADVRAEMSRLTAGGIARLIPHRRERSALHRSGRQLPIELGLSVVDAEDGIQVVASAQDISERTETGALTWRRDMIVRSLGEAILSIALDGTIEGCNPAAEQLYGYAATELVGASADMLQPAQTTAAAPDWDALSKGGGVSVDSNMRRKDDTVIDVAVTFSPLRDEQGEVMGVVSVARDVSASKRDAQRLAAAESRFAGAFEAASTGMALTSPDGRFLAVNRALCEFLGRDAETLLASGVQAVTHPDDLAADIEQGRRALAGEIDSFQQPKRYILPSGRIVWGLLTISISRDAQGVPQHYVSQVEDITDRKTAEGELLRYAAQLQALSEQDPLTGLANQHAFEASLDEELRVLNAGGVRCSVLLAKIDGDDGALIAAAESMERASRDTDLSAHLGNGELAVLFPNVDTRTAAEIGERIVDALGHRLLRTSQGTARSGETTRELLHRVRQALPPPEELSPATARPPAPQGITRLLTLAHDQLGMPITFLTRLEGEDYVFVRFAGDHESFGVSEGDAMSLAGSYCQRMLDGRIASTVPDLADHPQTRNLELTTQLGLRAYAGVPVCLRSGAIYGTLCGVDTRPHPELGERQAQLLGFLGELAAELIEDEIDQPKARRAEAAAAGVRTLLGALEARDVYTSAHSKQVVDLASAVALRLGADPEATRAVEQVALLHDIGKVGIPDAILQKQGPLDAREWELMRQHPIVGERIIASTPGLSELAPAVRAEHEHWDGGGYPDGLAGEHIPLASRITLACDALNAMTTDRPYRLAMSLESAQQELRACAGTQFDPDVVQALLAVIATTPQTPATQRSASHQTANQQRSPTAT
jgi:PAS domain S-box-containing protein